MSSPVLVVGLGNPGPEYAHTRHNVGFDLVDHLVRAQNLTWKTPWFRSVRVAGSPALVCAKPQTFMNRSGTVLPYLLSRFRVSGESLCVVVDNMDLPVGEVRMKRRGGPAGHNGLKSVSEALQSDDYARIYIGIGRPVGTKSTVEHVLGHFPPEQRLLVDDTLGRIAPVFERVGDMTLEQLISAVNERRRPPDSTDSDRT